MNNKPTIIYKAIVGSTMHGLRTENSDEDIRFVTMPSLRQIISPFKNDQIKVRDGKGEDEESWSLSHFCKHLTSGNPTVYEVIRTDHYDRTLPHAEAIRSLMPLAFDGRKIMFAHIGYAEAQLKRYLRVANEDFWNDYQENTEPDCYDSTGQPHYNYWFDSSEQDEILYKNQHNLLSELWEENKLRRVAKSIVAGYRVLAQGKQLLTTGDFEPVIKNYSPELYDKLMEIKTMDSNKITWGFVVEHHNGIENGIQELKAIFENLPDNIKNKTPDITQIENILCDIYGLK